MDATRVEALLNDGTGKVSTDVLLSCHIPTFADDPRSEIHVAATSDALGPRGAKSMSESAFNPVGPALANALRDATSIRFTSTLFRRDDVYPAL
ncbi:MAG: nicotinate dehydrogenase medium molybdopterin subunit [Paeniglutamicibacter sp.]